MYTIYIYICISVQFLLCFLRDKLIISQNNKNKCYYLFCINLSPRINV